MLITAMSITGIKRLCERAKADQPMVKLMLPRKATGKRISLAGENGPFGDVLQVTEADRTVAAFDPNDVLAFLILRQPIEFVDGDEPLTLSSLVISMDAQKAVDVLNRALKADPVAMNDLLSYRVPCNKALADDPTIQVRDQRGEFSISAFGLINGILGADKDGWGFIEATIDVCTREIRSFHVSERYVAPGSNH